MDNISLIDLEVHSVDGVVADEMTIDQGLCSRDFHLNIRLSP